MINTTELSEEENTRLIFSALMLKYRGSMPGIITKIYKVGGTFTSVDIKPAIVSVINDDLAREVIYQKMPILNQVPVVFPYGQKSGLLLSIPLQIGDDCLITCCDRNIDNWKIHGGEQRPHEPIVSRTYNLSDAIATPGVINDTTGILDYDENSIELRNASGTLKISITPPDIFIKNESSEITITSDTIILKADNIELDSANVTTQLVSGNLNNHVHFGIIRGGESTDPPT